MHIAMQVGYGTSIEESLVPICITAIGPRNVALAAEVAEGWEPILYRPGKATEVWGEVPFPGTQQAGRRARGAERRRASFAVTEDPARFRRRPPRSRPVHRRHGTRNRNIYCDLVKRYGFEQAASTIQDLYLDGKKDEAAASVPGDLVDALSLIGRLKCSPSGLPRSAPPASRRAGPAPPTFP